MLRDGEVLRATKECCFAGFRLSDVESYCDQGSGRRRVSISPGHQALSSQATEQPTRITPGCHQCRVQWHVDSAT